MKSPANPQLLYSMIRIRFILAAVLLAPSAIFAAQANGPKAKILAKYDLDHDGKLSAEEIVVIQKDFTAAPAGELARFDTDKDGKLSDDEIAKMIPGSGKKKDGEKKSGGKKKEADTVETPVK